MSTHFLSLPIIGLPYHDADKALNAPVNRKAARLRLTAEYSNPNDPDAVSVHLADGTDVLKIGYIPKDLGTLRQLHMVKGAAWIDLTTQPKPEKGKIWLAHLLVESDWLDRFSILDKAASHNTIKAAAIGYTTYNLPLPALFSTPDNSHTKPIVSSAMTHRRFFSH